VQAELVEPREKLLGGALDVRETVPMLSEPGLIDHAGLQYYTAPPPITPSGRGKKQIMIHFRDYSGSSRKGTDTALCGRLASA